ncbi:SGNH/GDSL hydrolase family protein [Nocardia aurantia]|uniref:Lipase 2 n=1 Tax=Nocardia aurantia TaxID=2585199 RepID=A0A7K0DRS0_9NOCA|nr:SGNH/GDSL hydrolase family protein [Nocardia aurantia]MQY27514.1 Lipase 2 [Nocardia aurantia]
MKKSFKFANVFAGIVAITALSIRDAPAHDAPSVEYASLGDSFSAAAGVLPLVPDSPLICTRSQRNFAHIIANRRNYVLTDVSCAGAETADLYREQGSGIPPQLIVLNDRTDLVTLTIGGNDQAVFGTAATGCARELANLPQFENPCESFYGTSFVDSIKSTTYPDLVRALSTIHYAAPHAAVLVVGYPWLVPESGDCIPQMLVAPADIPYLRNLQVVLNDAIRQAAEATDSIYVDMSVASDGRDACQPRDRRLVEPMLLPTQFMPLHPNLEGQEAIAEEVMKAIDE